MKILNKNQVDALFQCEAILIGTEDCVPTFRAEALFGSDAVKHAGSVSSGKYLNGYGVGDYTLMYITYRGFLAAATFHNVRQLHKEEEA